MPPYGMPPVPWRPRPGIIPLRPIGLGEIFDGAFQAIRANPRTMLGVSAVVTAIVTVVGMLPQYYYLAATVDLTETPIGPDDTLVAADFAPLAASLGGVFVTALVKSVATTMLTALLVTAVAEAVLGRRLAPGPLWRRVRPRIWGVLGLGLAVVLLPLLAVAAIVALGTGIGFALAAAGVPGGVAIVLVVLVGLPSIVVVGAFLWVKLALAPPALLLENAGVGTALRRSWLLARGSWWRLYGILLLTSILVVVVATVLAVPFSITSGIVVGVGQGGTGSLVGSTVLSGLGEIIVGTVSTPFSAAVVSLLYVDRRMRAEGLDVELLRAAGVPGVPGGRG
jgi:hypothetical protein